MNLISIILIILVMVFCPDLAAQGGLVTLDHVSGNWPGDPGHLITGQVEFYLRINNQSGQHITGLTNGFELYSPDGASHQINQVYTEWNHAVNWSSSFDGGVFLNYFSGPGADTVGFGAFSLFSAGYPDGQSDIAFIISTSFDGTDNGKTVCLDTCYYPPAGIWRWSLSDVPDIAPSWDGPHCWVILELPCKKTTPPASCPGTLVGSHCDLMSFDFGTEWNGYPINQVGGVGYFDPSTGIWSYQPSLADVGSALSVLMEYPDPICGATICQTDLTFTNMAPVMIGGCGRYVPLYGPMATVQLSADPVDCDANIFFQVESISPPNEGITVDAISGLVTCLADSLIPDTLYKAAVSVTDGVFASDTCWVWFIKATCQTPGNMNHLGGVDISDMVYLVGYLFYGGFPPPAFEEGDVDGSGFIDIADLTYFVDYMFAGGPAPVPCP